MGAVLQSFEMSWDPAYSFGNPNAQPPTPLRTPTSTTFTSPNFFQTPRSNNGGFDVHGGWSTKYTEDFSVFNGTPGQFGTPQFSSFTEPSPRPSITPGCFPVDCREQVLAQQPVLHQVVHQGVFSQAPSPLPTVEPARTLASSPATHAPPGGAFGIPSNTPARPRRRLEEAFSGNAATPPHSLGKHARISGTAANGSSQCRNEMADEIDIFSTPGQYPSLDFSTLGNAFAYPQPPATAPAYGHGKTFWDTDSSMTGMDLAHPGMTHAQAALGLVDQRPNSALEWNRASVAMGQHVQLHPPVLQSSEDARRNRSLATTPLQYTMPQQQSFPAGVAMQDDPFSAATGSGSGAVNPGLLFTIPPEQSPRPMSSAAMSTQQRGPSHPYEHQQSERLRDIADLRRSRSAKDLETSVGSSRPSLLSPLKAQRPSLQRSASDSRFRRTYAMHQRPRITDSTTSTFGASHRVASPINARGSGRISPSKQLHSRQSTTNLASIPEANTAAPLTRRPTVVFSIDENGRAQVSDAVQGTRNRSLSQRTTGEGPPAPAISDRSDSTCDDSSSDDEPILIPSRQSSFAMPSTDESHTKHSRKTAGSTTGRVRASSSSSLQSIRSSMTEGETAYVDHIDRRGSSQAQSELLRAKQRLQERRTQDLAELARQQQVPITTISGYTNAALLMSHNQFGSGANTPSTGSDIADMMRCVCYQKESNGFIIQCESCEKWLHGNCVDMTSMTMPKVYICAFCANTPVRGTLPVQRGVGVVVGGKQISPLAHKQAGAYRRG